MSDPLVHIVIPVLGRPKRAAAVYESASATTVPHEITFACSPGDKKQIEACDATGAWVFVCDWRPDRADWARKINAVYRDHSVAPWLLLAADDLTFHPGWAEAALEAGERTGAGVVGTNDLSNPRVIAGRHSTHPLVRRAYADEFGTIDGPGQVVAECYDHQFCNPPEAPIWMGDLSFRALGDIEVGDSVIGWERPALNPSDPAVIEQIRSAQGSQRVVAERFGVSPTHVHAIRHGRGGGTGSTERRWKAPLKRLRVSEVLAVRTRRSALVRVVMESGRELRCTPDHLWLNGTWSPSSAGREWVQATERGVLLNVADPEGPVPAEMERLAGWLGGIFDGEGSGAPNPQIAQSQRVNGPLYAKICEALDAFEIPYTMRDDRVWLNGGRRGLLRFINIARPFRIDRLNDYVLGSSRFGIRDRVVRIVPDGEGSVVSLTTETGNYVAWGYASKNCDDELVATAQRRHKWAFARGSHVEHLHPYFGKGPMDATYRKALRATRADQQLFSERRRLIARSA